MTIDETKLASAMKKAGNYQLVDVTDVCYTIHLLNIRAPSALFKTTYALMEYPIISKTYSPIAEVAAILCSGESCSKVVIAQVVSSEGRVSFYHVSTEYAAGENRVSKGVDLESISPTDATGGCIQMHLKSLNSPMWFRNMFKSKYMTFPQSCIHESQPNHTLVKRAADMPSLMGMIDL